MLRYFEKQYDRFIDNNDDEREKTLVLNEVIKLEEIFVNRTVSELGSGDLINNNSAIDIL